MLVRVVLASDDRYVPTMSVAIRSIIDNAKPENDYELIILSDKISEANKNRLTEMIAENENFSVSFFDVENLLSDFDFSIRSAHLSRCAFARLALPDMMPGAHKVVYVDGDIILFDDIAKLYRTELGNNIIAAVADPYVAYLRENDPKTGRYIERDLGLEEGDAYLNSGVLVINMDEFRRKYTARYMLELGTYRRWTWEDQDILNILCKGSVTWLPIKWNVIWGMVPEIRDEMMNDDEYAKAYRTPGIIHFAGGCLPTKLMCDIHKEEFWEVAKRTPFYKELQKETENAEQRIKEEKEKTDEQRNAEAALIAETVRAGKTDIEHAEDFGLYYNIPEICDSNDNGLKRFVKKLMRRVFRFVKSGYEEKQIAYNKKTMLALYELAKRDAARKANLNNSMLECEMIAKDLDE